MSAYADLQGRFKRLSTLGEAAGFLHWDMSTVMPTGGAESRAEQLAVLTVVCHDLLTAPDMEDLFGAAEADVDGDAWNRANLREMRRRWVHAVAVPGDLVEALSRACSRCEMVWREARPEADFPKVVATLDEVLRLVKETAAAKATRLDCSLYDALLDQYEPDGRSADIDRVFADLADFLPDFITAVLERQATLPEIQTPPGPFPVADQRRLAERLMGVLGFDFDHGRLDTSLHPFCGGTPDDVRITTRYDETDFTQALMGVLHETGHALYEMGLPTDWRHQPVGEARGMGMHESQSLLVEMQACRSPEFIAFAAPLMREAFGVLDDGDAWSTDNLQRLYTRVERGFIRVDADEVTYPAHVIMRYRLEKAMIADDLAVADLPGAWNEGLRELLGVEPPDDRLGCLQDIHWYDGAWGYFPTYTLGAMTAAQLFDAACGTDTDILLGVARGDFGPLMSWLRTNVHGKGSLLSADGLLTEATGRSLDPAVFERHLAARYLGTD